MRKVLLLLIGIYTNDLLGQIVIIKDSLLNTPIESATLSFKNSGAASDEKGVIDISPFNDDDIVEISHISYNTKKIIKKNIGKIIYMSQKTNILPEVILSEVIKIPISEKYPIFTITPIGINELETSIADLLSSESSVVIQESQVGGGSPNYRGMEANRLLLIVDDIPLNNAIYRSGHLQNSATINPFFIESISLLSGPASVAYGNGAMGGALIFNTQKPMPKNSIRFNQQFESSSNAVITSFQANYYSNKIYHITAFSLKSAANLKMGNNRNHGYENWGKEATNQNEQLYTNFTQADFLHKSNYRINKKNSVLINTQYSKSSNIYRFDQMNDLKDGVPEYKHWYYGPQIRFLQSINYTAEHKTIAFDNIKTTLAFQNIKESRHTQKVGEELLNNRNETVKIYDFNMDFNKQIQKIKLAYGIGTRNQQVFSTANLSNNNSTFYNTTRYPEDGSAIQDFFAYSQVNFPLNKKLDLLLGGRWNSSELRAKYNNPTFSFEDIENNNTSFIKSALISFNPIRNTTINAAYYGGFRNPNIDDIGKIFSKDDITVVVPNANLEPEYASNFELSVNYVLSPLKIQIQLFNTQISNAINREYGTLNGADSMLYDGQMMRIQMNKNIESATINGASLSADFAPSNNFLIAANCNYLNGETNDNKPLAHIPPFNAKISFSYLLKQHTFDFYTHYNGWKLAENYDEAGVDNLVEATSDGNPSWYTLNLAYTNKIDNTISFTFAVKNILDAHYKTFASGLSASGRNFVIALHTTF